MANNGTSPFHSLLEAWFPVTKGAWRLDAVTLLAVIGELSMSDHAQPVTASVLCLLPRFLPAPQALLKPTRPARLPGYPAKMAGVHSGVVSDSVGFFANIIHPLEEQMPFSFKVLEVKHREEGRGERAVKGDGDRLPAGVEALPRKRRSFWVPSRSRTSVVHDDDVEAKDNSSSNTINNSSSTRNPRQENATAQAGPAPPKPDETKRITRRRTAREKVTDLLANPTLTPAGRPAVPPALDSPIHVVTVSSFVLTLFVLCMVAYWRDGNALLAVFVLSAQSSLVGYASWWKPRLMARPPHPDVAVPPGDMIIRTREGAFVLVKCTEDVTRELYGAGAECEYRVGGRAYRSLMAVGTALLMVGVVLLGNVKFNAQALIAGSYIVLNGAYWLLGMLPRRYFWDLSRYEWRDMTPADARDAHLPPGDGLLGDDGEHPSYTKTLWYAIRETRQTGWVGRSGAAPGTALWRRWLEEAGENARGGNRGWPAVKRKNDIIGEGMAQPASPGEPRTDAAEQHAPLDEIQLMSTSPDVPRSGF